MLSYFPNSFQAVTRRHAINVGLEKNQALYLQQLYTRPCTNLMTYKLNSPHKIWHSCDVQS